MHVNCFYPVSLWELEPGDVGYDQGGRFMVTQVDGGRYGFPTREDADVFMASHGMEPINAEDLAAIRRALNVTPVDDIESAE